MDAKRDPQVLTLRDLVKKSMRRWRVIITTVIICACGGLLLGQLAPKTYTATATLMVSPITTNPFSSAAVNQQINITTERVILGSSEVAQLAATALGGGISPKDLQSSSETAAPSGSQILQVSVTLNNGGQAAKQANALAEAYLEFRSQGAIKVASGYVKQLDDRINSLKDLRSRTEGDRLQLEELLQQQSSLNLAATNPGRIIGFAVPSADESSMGLLVFLTAGIVGGCLLGFALALLREKTDRNVRYATRLSEILRKEVVCLEDEDDEAGRWLTRMIRLTGTQDDTSKPIFVGVINLASVESRDFSAWLAKMNRCQGKQVHLVEDKDIDAENIDRGWPQRINTEPNFYDIELIEIDRRLHATRLADLSGRMDMIFLIVGKHTLRRTAQITLSLIQDLPIERIFGVFVVPRKENKKLLKSEYSQGDCCEQITLSTTESINPTNLDNNTKEMEESSINFRKLNIHL